jgi:hypothetical protein
MYIYIYIYTYIYNFSPTNLAAVKPKINSTDYIYI